jgi:RIO kinase 1
MSTYSNFDPMEELEDLNNIRSIRNVSQERIKKHSHQKRKTKAQPDQMVRLAEQENELSFTYNASKHESEWLISSLRDFYQQHWFSDIIRLIKGGGKEASVYQCLSHESMDSTYIAAKVYRPRKFRQIRNDSLYREGRLHFDDEGHEIHDDRALHAIQKRTHFGKALLHTSWIEHEFQTMETLYETGAVLPKPLASGNNAILMDYIGWDDLPAPTLNTVKLQPKAAQRVFDQVIHNIDIMLENQRVHGDLSAFNILYYEGQIFLIDFPQAIDPEQNRNAYGIFKRDIMRLCEYFDAQRLSTNPSKLARDLWRNHGYPLRPQVDLRLLEPETIEED